MTIQNELLKLITKGRRTTLEEMKTSLNKRAGSQFLTVLTKTIPKMRKNGNPYFGKVSKISRFNGTVGFDYDAAVERRLNKEGTPLTAFSRGASALRVELDAVGRLTPFSRHPETGAEYLRMMLTPSATESVFVSNDTGEEVLRTDLEPYLSDTGGYSNQGLKDPVRIITPRVENIVAVVTSGETLVVSS